MGHTYEPNNDFSFLSEKPVGVLRKAIGAWAWVITGDEEKSSTQYRLVGVYSPSKVMGDGRECTITGPGTPFMPPLLLNDLPWFQELRKEQGNFGFGFNAINNANVIIELECLLTGAAARHESSSETVVATFFSNDGQVAHEELQSWRREHNDGFVLNCVRVSAGIIHRADCPHMGGDEWTPETGQDLARKPKICSVSLPSLRGWAAAHNISDIRTCADCKPADDDQTIAQLASDMLEQGLFTSEDAGDARRRVTTSIVQSQGQPAFRNCLLAAYRGRCAVTGCDVNAVLEAAHIVPYQGVWTNHPQNGLLLRADIHTLFDLHFLTIDTRSMTVLAAPKLQGSSYTALAGSALAVPAEPELRPSVWALNEHRKLSGLAQS